jgi:amino acid permease
MNAIGRVFGVLAAMAVGSGTALIVLPLLIIFDPLSSDTGLIASLEGFADLLDRTLDDLPTGEAVTLFASFIWIAALAICVLPVVVIALIGEIASVRNLIWYSGATGLLSASMPWLLRATYHLNDVESATPVELHFALLFFLTGTAAGLIYWLICGRRAGLFSRMPVL